MDQTNNAPQTKDDASKAPSKTKNRIMGIIAVVILVAVGISFFVFWQQGKYFKTENAKVTTELYKVTPSVPGRLIKLTVQEGSRVKANEVIGRVENGGYLKSPIDGEIIKVDGTLNEMVAPTNVVAVVADTENMYIGANIEETDIGKIKEGQDVIVQLDAFPGKKFTGTVSSIDKLTQTALTGNQLSFSTGGTYTKVTQLIPVQIKLRDQVELQSYIGTNATVKINIR